MSEFNGESLQSEIDADDADTQKMQEAIEKIKNFLSSFIKKKLCICLTVKKMKINKQLSESGKFNLKM